MGGGSLASPGIVSVALADGSAVKAVKTSADATKANPPARDARRYIPSGAFTRAILLGGLVSSIGGNTARGVPILGQLPVIGKLFRTDGESENRTELMVLVIPYVVRSPEEAAELSRTLTQPL